MASEWEANLLVHRLEDEGVRASAMGGYTAGFIAEAPGSVGIFVDSRDETQARSILQGYFEEKKQRAQGSLDGPGDDPSAVGNAKTFENRSSRAAFWVWFILLVSVFWVMVPFLLSLPLSVIVGLVVGSLGIAFWFRRFLV